MTARDFLEKYHQLPEQINGEPCLKKLKESADLGLAGNGGLPMILSYLPGSVAAPEDGICAVMDAGGTNLRTALARFEKGYCRILDIRTVPMPGSGGVACSAEELYGQIAKELARFSGVKRLGCCFSYLVDMERNLDGRLREWCKEIRCPDAVGQYVGKSILNRLPGCETVTVLNDTAAAYLGAKQKLGPNGGGLVGLIMGTGVNVCYSERREYLTKLEADIRCPDMIVNTEVCEFDGIPLGEFERRVILRTDDPSASRAEKQCSGAYLGDIILEALREAKEEGILARMPERLTLSAVSDLLGNKNSTHRALFEEKDLPFVLQLLDTMVDRSAKIGAILCAEFVRRIGQENPEIVIVVEGSLFWKMHRFPERFCRELKLLLPQISFQIREGAGACLEGAAVAAFGKGV